MTLNPGTVDQPGYLHHGDARCGRLFTFFYCHRRFTMESLPAADADFIQQKFGK